MIISNGALSLNSTHRFQRTQRPTAKASQSSGETFATTLNQTAGLRTPAASAPPPSAVATGGAAATSAARSLYDVAGLPNGGLMLNPTGNNALTGGFIPYNPNYYATQQAASELAAQLGGTVVDLGEHISNNQPEYFIALPNGITVNAGNLLAVLNNPVFRENSRVMDGKVAEFLNNNAIGTPGAGIGLYSVQNGRVSFDPNGRPTVYST